LHKIETSQHKKIWQKDKEDTRT